MSWSEIFPILSENHLKQYQKNAPESYQKAQREAFLVDSVHAPKSRSSIKKSNKNVTLRPKHIVSVTLFWKNIMPTEPEVCFHCMDDLINARRNGTVSRFSPWENYVEPMLHQAPWAMSENREVEFRVYLANDLQFLIPELTAVGWTVHLMKSASERYCPGGFWRFLALEEDALVTVVDADRAAACHSEIKRTETMHELGLGLWRVPGYYNAEVTHGVRYKPILGGHFGARGGDLPICEMIAALRWHCENESIRKTAIIPGIGEKLLPFTTWPGYGFDEVFLLVALYPRLVRRGTLSFLPVDARSLLLPVDLEYAQWANPRSESFYF